MTPVQDLLAALVAHLRAQTLVSALTGARVYGTELPAFETPHMPRHALVLSPAGGVPHGYLVSLSLDAMRIDAWSYGATPFEAMRLRRAVRAAMRSVERVRVGTALIHWVVPAGGFMEDRDPQARWPRVFESFTLMGSELAAA